MHKTARFNTEQFRCYSEGYYWGVVMALRVAVEAVERWKLNEQTRRATARAKRNVG